MPQTNIPVAKKLAKKLGVSVKPSVNPCKKLDVFNEKGKKIQTIGSRMHADYLQHKDAKKRTSYKKRTEKHRHKLGSASYYADKILWPSDSQMKTLV